MGKWVCPFIAVFPFRKLCAQQVRNKQLLNNEPQCFYVVLGGDSKAGEKLVEVGVPPY